MPFERSARVELVNEADRPIRVSRFEVRWHPAPQLPENAGYFHVAYRLNADCSHGVDFNALAARGRGKPVGASLTMQGLRLGSPRPSTAISGPY